VELGRLGSLAMGTNEDGLPTLPLKMLLWHILWASHVKPNANSVATKRMRLAFIFTAMVFSTSIVLRALQGGLPTSGLGITLLASYILCSVLNSYLEIAFIVVASLDYQRRYEAARMLH